MTILDKILGPRVPSSKLAEDRGRFLTPTMLLVAAAILLVVSIFLPYWRLVLRAPQYPQGLQVTAFLNQVTGDVREIDGLNHYIGMRPLAEAAELERTLSIFAVSVIGLLVVGGIWIHSRWAAYLTLPAILFPAIFLADLQYWLRDFGTNLDPTAPLSSSIKPFVPPVLGEGVIGQFSTVASAGPGWYVAFTASLLIVAGLWFHRRAYKPLFEASRTGSAG